jgi:hypothetical protein
MVERFPGIEHEFLQETVFCWGQFYLFASNSYLPLSKANPEVAAGKERLGGHGLGCLSAAKHRPAPG